MNKKLDIILNILIIVGLTLIIVDLIQEIIIGYKVTKQDNCIKINKAYYCEIK